METVSQGNDIAGTKVNGESRIIKDTLETATAQDRMPWGANDLAERAGQWFCSSIY